jgi:hypothetical protein
MVRMKYIYSTLSQGWDFTHNKRAHDNRLWKDVDPNLRVPYVLSPAPRTPPGQELTNYR